MATILTPRSRTNLSAIRPELRALFRCLHGCPEEKPDEPDYAAADPHLVGVLAELRAMRGER